MPLDYSDLPDEQPKNGGKVKYDDLPTGKKPPKDAVVDRSYLLPVVKTAEGRVEFGFPGVLKDAESVVKAPGDVLKGKRDPEEAGREVAMALAGSGIAGRIFKPVPRRGIVDVEFPKATSPEFGSAKGGAIQSDRTLEPGAQPISEAGEKLKAVGNEPPEALPEAAGNINLERIDTPDDVKRTIFESSKAFESQIDEA